MRKRDIKNTGKKNIQNIDDNFILVDKVESDAIIKTFKNQTEFVQFYIGNIDYVNTQLNDSEKKVLFVCAMEMNRNNCIKISSDFRQTLILRTEVNRNTVSKAINSLIEKEILIKIEPDKLDEIGRKKLGIALRENNIYLISPEIFGKGSARDILQVKEVIVKHYNWEENKYEKRVLKEFDYAGLNDIKDNPKSFKIKDVVAEYNDSGGKNVEISLEDYANHPDLFPDNAPKLISSLSDDTKLKSDYDKEIAEYMELKLGFEKELNKKMEELRKKFAKASEK